jgi:1-aminocyclopropane-1-carboxylate deaminase
VVPSLSPAVPLGLRLPSPLRELDDGVLAAAGVRLFLKRDDLISAAIPGNKWRKLKHNLQAARDEGHEMLLTFGGAYSNHILATAAAGYHYGFATVGVIRGEEHRPLNPVLAAAAEYGMRLEYLDRGTYRDKEDPALAASLRRRFGRFCLLPEGGSNALAARGCAEIAAEISVPFGVICCPCGSGGTLAGLAHGLGPGQRALGFSVLRGGEFLGARVAGLQEAAFGAVSANWSIEHGYHFSGFARRTPALGTFIAGFADRHGLVLDRVYTAKMMYGLFTLAGQGAFAPGSTVVAVITGRPDGAQGSGPPA